MVEQRNYFEIELKVKDAIVKHLRDSVIEYAHELRKIRAILRTPRLYSQFNKAKEDLLTRQYLIQKINSQSQRIELSEE